MDGAAVTRLSGLIAALAITPGSDSDSNSNSDLSLDGGRQLSIGQPSTGQAGDGTARAGAGATVLAPATTAADVVSDAMLAALASLLGLHHECPDTDDVAARGKP